MRNHVWTAFLIGAALLAPRGTAAAQTTMEQELAARTCELPKIADTAPLEQVPGSDLVTVPVAINGTPHQFLLDIGLKRPTAVSPELMAQLGLPEAFRMGQPTAAPGLGAYGGGMMNVQICDLQSGLGCSERMDRVRVGSFAVGNATGRHLQFAVAEKGEIARSAPYDGFLTGDFLRRYDAELDFAGKQMTWLTPTSCTDPNQVVFWAHSAVAIIPVSLARDGRLQMEAMVGGHLIYAELDTSASRTVMRRDIAELYVGLKAGTPDMVAEGDLQDGMHMQVYNHIFPQMIFAGGGVTALNVPVRIQTFSMRPSASREKHLRGSLMTQERIPDLSIGMDVLQHLHMYVVPGQGKVYVTANE